MSADLEQLRRQFAEALWADDSGSDDSEELEAAADVFARRLVLARAGPPRPCRRPVPCHREGEAMSETEQPPIGGFCDNCGHFAGRHDEDGCHWPERKCDCPGMTWQGVVWPRPWLAAPEGLSQ